MPGRKAYYAADPALRARHEQTIFFDRLRRCLGQKGREIVVEDKRVRVGRILRSLRPRIPRAEIAVRIVGRHLFGRFLLDLAEPRALCAMRGDEHPFAAQRIEPPVWAVLRFRSEEHTSELQSRQYLVCRLLLEKKN